MTDTQVRIARALEGLEKAAAAIAKTGEQASQASAKLQHPAYSNRPEQVIGILEEQLSTTFSLELPDIQGRAQFYVQKDGFLRIEILVEPPDSERLVGLVNSMGIREFVVSAQSYDENFYD